MRVKKLAGCGHADVRQLPVEDSGSVVEGIREMPVRKMEISANDPGQDVAADDELDAWSCLDVVQQVDVVLTDGLRILRS